MKLFCPRCRGLVESTGDSSQGICTCPKCHSTFPVDAAATLAADAERTVNATEYAPVLVESQTIGRFQIQCEIGRGGYGTVFKAYDPELRRMVALKVPRHDGLETDRERFQREARNASQLHHPAIVPIFDLGESQGHSYIVSELIEGSTLASLLTCRKF